ncbi:MAG: DUF4625 domain-containing protein [Hymenobacteraceae bacterium]|nr:DUF4625 domain-containing protein [Hymenobacteraceae bacterium]
MRKLNWLFLLLFSFTFFACDDDDDAVLDTTAPTIVITSPTNGQNFNAGDQMNVRADITDNFGLEEVRVLITPPGGTPQLVDDDSINDFLNDDREKDLDIDVDIDANATPGVYRVTVEADDDAGNTASQFVTVNVN